MTDQSIYYEPLTITEKDNCFFYHTIDLKNGETVHGNWDLRGREEAYFGGTDFAGKRALDVGCATGFLTFAMEDRGAQVTSLELGPGATMSRDYVPFAAHDYREHIKGQNRIRRTEQKMQKDFSDEAQAKLHAKQLHRLANPDADTGSGSADQRAGQRIDSPYSKDLKITDQHNGYFYCHTANNSKAKLVYRSVYEMPREMGPFDVTMYGSILLHLRDPFFALHNGCRLTEETVIVTDVYHNAFQREKNHPVMLFAPSPKDKSRIATFWMFSPQIIVQMLGVLGFEDAKISYHSQKTRGVEKDMFTVVAHRTAPFNPAMTY